MHVGVLLFEVILLLKGKAHFCGLFLGRSEGLLSQGGEGEGEEERRWGRRGIGGWSFSW